MRAEYVSAARALMRGRNFTPNCNTQSQSGLSLGSGARPLRARRKWLHAASFLTPNRNGFLSRNHCRERGDKGGVRGDWLAIRLRSACDPRSCDPLAIRLRSTCDPLAIHLRSCCDFVVGTRCGQGFSRGASSACEAACRSTTCVSIYVQPVESAAVCTCLHLSAAVCSCLQLSALPYLGE